MHSSSSPSKLSALSPSLSLYHLFALLPSSKSFFRFVCLVCVYGRKPSSNSKPHKANDMGWEAIQELRDRDGAVGLSHFKLVKRLGCGDIGSVYLCELRGTDCYFAMKVRQKLSREMSFSSTMLLSVAFDGILQSVCEKLAGFRPSQGREGGIVSFFLSLTCWRCR
jgi:hypothetical protein